MRLPLTSGPCRVGDVGPLWSSELPTAPTEPPTALRAWWDVSIAASLVSSPAGGPASPGGTVGQLLDQSGNDLHASQALAYARPTYSATGGASGDQPELIFDGGNDQLVTDVITRTGPGTLVFAGRIASAFGIFAHHDITAGGLIGDYLIAGGTGRYRGVFQGTASGVDLNDGGYHTIVFVVDPDATTTARLYVDGALVWSSDDPCGTDSLTGPVYLGALADSVWNGAVRLHEARIYDSALSEAQAIALSSELATKWGM